MSWTLELDQRPLTVNKMRTLHYMKRAQHDEEWRGIFWLLAEQQQIPRCDAISVVVHQELKNRAHVPDIGACFPSVKAAIDGLVDAGVIEDDDPEHLIRLTFMAPRVTGRDALVLTVYEYGAEL